MEIIETPVAPAQVAQQTKSDDQGQVRNSKERTAKKSPTEELVELAHEFMTLHYSTNMEAYASFENSGHRECWSLSSCTDLLSHRYYQKTKKVPSEAALRGAIATLAGEAKFAGHTDEVFFRVGHVQESSGERGEGGEPQKELPNTKTYWLDLANEDWQAISITKMGWEIVNKPPVLFRRSNAMRALPTPIPGGNIEPLWDVINILESDRDLLLVWILESLRPDTPYAVLELVGEQGSAKSSTQSNLRDLIDPNSANNRAAPKSVNDVYIAARNSHIVSFENISHLPAAYQDALCILATGGGFATRTLYTNTDETVIDIKKPIVINGISTNVTAQDLLDRTLHLNLPTISARKTTEEMAARFDSVKGEILGGLLDLFVNALRLLPSIIIPPNKLPRMADLAMLGEAVYRALGRNPGEFLQDYQEKRRENVQRTLDASPVASALLDYVDKRPGGFSGTVKDLFEALDGQGSDKEAWPKTAKGFADALRRCAPALRLMGIEAKIGQKPTRRGYPCELKRLSDSLGAVDGDTGVGTLFEVHHVHDVHPVNDESGDI